MLWAKIFNLAAFLVALAGTLLFTFAIAMGNNGPGGAGMSPSEKTTVFVVAGVITLFLTALFLVPAAGLNPGRGWLWIWQWATLAFFALASMFTCVALVALPVVLTIYWLKPEVRAYLDGASP